MQQPNAYQVGANGTLPPSIGNTTSTMNQQQQVATHSNVGASDSPPLTTTYGMVGSHPTYPSGGTSNSIGTEFHSGRVIPPNPDPGSVLGSAPPPIVNPVHGQSTPMMNRSVGSIMSPSTGGPANDGSSKSMAALQPGTAGNVNTEAVFAGHHSHAGNLAVHGQAGNLAVHGQGNRVYSHQGQQQIHPAQQTHTIPVQLDGAHGLPAPTMSTPTPAPAPAPMKKGRAVSPNRNLGFKMSSSLRNKHESYRQNCDEGQRKEAEDSEGNEREEGEISGSLINKGVKLPLYQFQVTKLRTWRTGYVRILSLYRDHISTFDPDSHQVTNTWSLRDLNEWMAVPKENDTILLQINSEKLKFSCCNTSRAYVLIALLQTKYEYEYVQGNANSGSKLGNSEVGFPNCQRQTRQGTRYNVTLIAAPHGILEKSPVTQKIIQTYRYTDIQAVSFITDDPNGIVFHLNGHNKRRLFFIYSSRAGGNGRSDLVTVVQDFYNILGLEFQMSNSMTTIEWVKQRKEVGKDTKTYGSEATSWQVTKVSPRHDSGIVGKQFGWVGGVVVRTLAITSRAYIIEKDAIGVVSCRELGDLHGIVRHQSDNQVTLEYNDGSISSYTCQQRDALLVSLLDVTSTISKTVVHLTDVPSAGYCLSQSWNNVSLSRKKPAKTGMFQPISIPVHCLKRLNAVSTAAYAYCSKEIEDGNNNIDIVQECKLLIASCREFNASVLPTYENGLSGSTSNDKYITGSIGALWGLISLLLIDHDDSQKQIQEETASCTFLQSLYRLVKTTVGYKSSVELSTMQEAIPSLLNIRDPFCKFWAFSVINALLSGTQDHGNRDAEAEYVNKSVILTTGGIDFMNGLVCALVAPASALRLDGDIQHTRGAQSERQISDLVLMTASDILQSILCSYQDTTKPSHFGILIDALAKQYRALLSTLRSTSTPFVIENTALLLHLLSTHAPHTASLIRDAALSSAILLHHFYASIFSPIEGQRFLSRFLCSLWLSGPLECDEKRLLQRMVPRGFLGYLKMPPLSKIEEEQLDELEKEIFEEASVNYTSLPSDDATTASSENTLTSTNDDSSASAAGGTNTTRLRLRITKSNIANNTPQQRKPENFRIFFHILSKDHALPDLIWNQQTRRELRIALESEIQYIHREAESRGLDNVAWNHQQFSVEYPSLTNEVKVGSVYMRLWLQAGDGFIRAWDEPLRLFELLFRRFLCEIDRNNNVSIMCIRCLERLYSIHAKLIGPFTDVMILVHSMASTKSIETQHRLLGLVATLLGVSSKDEDDDADINIPENAEQLLNKESIEQLCQFVAWGHTNGVQVGNLLTAKLSSTIISNRFLITDGTNQRPGGTIRSGELFSFRDSAASPKTNIKEDALDSICPPVWFVASTGRIPPPAESIRGPFRVSELVKMMAEGDLSPFDLVTTTHVDDYEDEEPHLNVKEAHIDTGKWKRIEQVWQLRWQLCTDGSVAGIYSPSDVALLAVKSLARLVDLHRSLDFRGVQYLPIPIAKRILCGLSRDPSAPKGDHLSQSSGQDSYLSILCQALLCNDHRVVDRAAQLLYELTSYNEEATSKFYLTGVFFFICCYTGSNFRSLAKLLHATHLKQNFRSGFAAAANETELPMKELSVLGHMIPQGLLFILINYGADRFMEVFVGNFDTPEVIWNFDMRKHLIEMIHQHLGDFPRRLWQCTTLQYEYCPMPGVAYERLEKEVFCHNYYLNNLCDEARFPDWPIAEPIEVFRATLEEFKKQINRNETDEEEKIEAARKVLKLKSGDGSKELRKAYRNLARQFHPDKNPAGREMFEKIQVSYELLLPIVESGKKIQALQNDDAGEEYDQDHGEEDIFEGFSGGKAQMEFMHVLLKTQVLICKRYEKELSRYKYPAYSILLSCVELPKSCIEARAKEGSSSLLYTCVLKHKRAEFTKTAVALIYYTCLVSPLNAEELVTEGGLSVLESLLDFYVHVVHDIRSGSSLSSELESEEIILEIISHLVHTISGISFYENGRAAILLLADPSRLFINWRRCIDSKFLHGMRAKDDDTSIKKYALEGIANMAKDGKLQRLLIGSGVVWPLLGFMLGYDPTLEQAMSSQGIQDDLGMSQAASNTLARLATRSLGMLCGVITDEALQSPRNEDLLQACRKLLTGPISLLLRNKRTIEILQTLNTNVESPTRIWNVSMRKELGNFLSKNEKERPESICQSVEKELKHVESFEYSNLRSELRIGGVYIRVFNRAESGKEAIREIHSASEFASQLTNFIALCVNSSEDLPKDWVRLPVLQKECNQMPPVTQDKETIEIVQLHDSRFVMTVTALRILVRVDGLIDDVLCAPSSPMPSVLLSLLEMPQNSEAFDIGCEILSILSPKQRFADAVASQGALWRLLMVLERSEGMEADNIKEHIQENRTDEREQIQRVGRGWSLMESFSSTPSIATKLVESAGWLELLGIVVGYAEFTKKWVARIGAAKTLSRLLWDPVTGPIIAPLLQRFLPEALVVVLKEEGAEIMLKYFDEQSDTPELIWDSSMRSELRHAIGEQLDECIKQRKDGTLKCDLYSLPPHFAVKYEKLANELYIGGVYLSRYIKEPTYNLRDPTTFLEMVLQRWTHEVQMCIASDLASSAEATSRAIINADQDVLQLVTNAGVYLCKVRDMLCDKLAQWGYMSRSLSFLDQILEKKLIGSPLLSVMRILHVACNRMINVESIAVCGEVDGKHGIVDFTIRAIGFEKLHPDTAFMLEILKKIFDQALGDVRSCCKNNTLGNSISTQRLQQQQQYISGNTSMQHYSLAPSPASDESSARKTALSNFGTMAPSPAPGEGQVRRGKVGIGDDPLAMPVAFQAQQSQRHQQIESQSAGHHPQHLHPMVPSPAPRPTTTGIGGINHHYSSQSMPGYSQQLLPQTQHAGNQHAPYQQTSYVNNVSSGHSVQSDLSFHQHQVGQPGFTVEAMPMYSATPTSVIQHNQPRSQHVASSMPRTACTMESSMQHHTPSLKQFVQPQIGMIPPTSNEARNVGQISSYSSQSGSQPAIANSQLPPAVGHYQNTSSATGMTLPSHNYATSSTVPNMQVNSNVTASQLQPQNYFPSQQEVHMMSTHGENLQQTGYYSHIPSAQKYSQMPTQTEGENVKHESSTRGNLINTHNESEVASSQQHLQRSTDQLFANQARSQPFQDPSQVQVETVLPEGETQNDPSIRSNDNQKPRFRPYPIEGTGIDARTKSDPLGEAEQKSMSTPGAAGSANGRVNLLQAALACKLPQFLLRDVLENPSLSSVKDPPAAKVHAVELLKLLTMDPGYGMKFQLILGKIPSWKKYKSQDHSLFITGGEQKTDYFLTDGDTGESKKLLTQG